MTAPIIFGDAITVSFRGATALKARATRRRPSIPKQKTTTGFQCRRTRDGILTLITKAAQLWLDKHRPDWAIVGVSQKGTDPDSYTVFTVPAYMAYGLRELGQNAIDAGKAMAAA